MPFDGKFHEYGPRRHWPRRPSRRATIYVGYAVLVLFTVSAAAILSKRISENNQYEREQAMARAFPYPVSWSLPLR